MSQSSRLGLRIRNSTRFYLTRLRERLWLKPLMSCVLSLLAAFFAGLADQTVAKELLPDISKESIETLLNIISSSMLVIAVFAVGSMLQAYASASNSATPRSFPLVVGDDISQNALAIFIGAFIFSIVALVALLNDFYGHAGRFVLFIITIFVFSFVILSLVRWVDRIARLGRLGNTVNKVEAATDAALALRATRPTLGAVPATNAKEGVAVYSDDVGYVQAIDVAKLQVLAEQVDCHITVCATPGTFACPGEPLAYVSKQVAHGEDSPSDDIADAFLIGKDRTFESDPRFGLVVLSEIASRALSPAVNDPGTAIDIVGTFVRLFVRWSKACDENDDSKVEYDRVSVPAISLTDMFDDAFGAVSRDGAALVEVGIRLQKGFHSLSLLGHPEMEKAAKTNAKLALRYAKQSLHLAEEYESLEKVSIQAYSR